MHTLGVLPNTKALAIQIPETSSELFSKLQQEGQNYFPWNLIYFQYTPDRNITLNYFKATCSTNKQLNSYLFYPKLYLYWKSPKLIPILNARCLGTKVLQIPLLS